MTPSTYKLSFQLYSTRNFPPQDDVLEGLAAMGYDAVETWLPDFATDAKGFRKRIDNAGLECLGFHMPLKGPHRRADEVYRYRAHPGGFTADDPALRRAGKSAPSKRTGGAESASSSQKAPNWRRPTTSALPGTTTTSNIGPSTMVPGRSI